MTIVGLKVRMTPRPIQMKISEESGIETEMTFENKSTQNVKRWPQ